MKTKVLDTKICIKCNIEKDINYFELRTDTKKRRNVCINCNIIVAKNRYQKSYIKTRRVGPSKNKIDYNKDYYNQNKQTIKEKQKKYRVKNKTNIRKYNNNLERNKRRNDPSFRLRKDLSRAIHLALKESNGIKHNVSVMKYINYTIQELRQHLESKFEFWMTWDNHGIYRRDEYNENDSSTWTWQIDHIIPQSKLSYSSMEDDNFKKCWALNNLRPLKSIDNIKKGNKIFLQNNVN